MTARPSITAQDALFKLLDYQLSLADRTKVLMMFTDEAWRRGWDDCYEAFAAFHIDESPWPVRPEPSHQMNEPK